MSEENSTGDHMLLLLLLCPLSFGSWKCVQCISFTDRVKATCGELIEVNVRTEEKAMLYRVKFYSVLRPYYFEVDWINPKSYES